MADHKIQKKDPNTSPVTQNKLEKDESGRNSSLILEGEKTPILPLILIHPRTGGMYPILHPGNPFCSPTWTSHFPALSSSFSSDPRS
ncbi:hypothetical protein NPIL_250071 [Nephila pilipes]|uniref:Uncharacterized protein n=1 Tax=Nephila pilipes TaxID=299642 RepID=A0A8X6NJ48_NEPPI|nr:hypothetical protein NPIL_250071 [Nephila pilipes]